MGAGNSNGVMMFGEENDYPQITEKIINNSVTAKSCARILASFIVGKGFDSEVNKIVVGYDITGKGVTVYELLKRLAYDIAYHNGCYIHIGQNAFGDIISLNRVPFKYCRFGKVDDLGYTSTIHVYENWEKYSDFKRDRIRIYPIYSSNPEVFLKRVEEAGGIEKFKGQIDYFFNENNYLYPLSNIDSIFHDADAEFGVSLLRDNIFRNGISGKVIITVASMPSDAERQKIIEKIKNLISADGDPVLLLEEEIGANGELLKSVRIDKIDTNMTSEMYADLDKVLAKRIRKAFYAIPPVLIDYEESKLGTTSGEALREAFNYYNNMTRELRTNFGEWIAGYLQELQNPTLEANNDWTIKELSIDTDNINAQTNQHDTINNL